MPKKDDDQQETKDDIKDQEEIVEKKDQKIEKLQAKIDKMEDKDQNFSKLREQKEKIEKEKEEAESEIASLEEKLNNKISKVRDEFASDKLWSEIDKRAGGDEELAEKIKKHYDSFRGDPESEEEKQERLDNAEVLATGGGGTKGLSGSAVRSGVGKPQTEHTTPDVKEDVKEFGKKKFGLKDEDFGDKNE